MQLRVRSRSRSGDCSDRAANHSSVHSITEAGEKYWAVDAKVEGSSGARLREGSIARFWRTVEDAEADVAEINRGEKFYKNTNRKYFDAVTQPAEAYWS